MNISSSTYRSDVQHLHSLLEKYGFRSSNLSSEFATINSQLNGPNFSIDFGLRFDLESRGRLIRYCREIHQAELTFNIRASAEYTNFQCIDGNSFDPFTVLNIDLGIKGLDSNGEIIQTAFHLDKHVFPEGNDEKDNLVLHPLYHFQFGGYGIDEVKNYGEIVFLDTPRLPHYPLDVILLIDFVLTNFLPEQRNIMIDDRTYVNLIKKYQEVFVKSYYNSFFGCNKLFPQHFL